MNDRNCSLECYNVDFLDKFSISIFPPRQLCQGLTGILQELVRQKMTNILIQVQL